MCSASRDTVTVPRHGVNPLLTAALPFACLLHRGPATWMFAIYMQVLFLAGLWTCTLLTCTWSSWSVVTAGCAVMTLPHWPSYLGTLVSPHVPLDFLAGNALPCTALHSHARPWSSLTWPYTARPFIAIHGSGLILRSPARHSPAMHGPGLVLHSPARPCPGPSRP